MTWTYLAAAFPEGHPRELPPQLAEALRRLGCVERFRARSLLLFAGDDLPLRSLGQDHAFVMGHLFDGSGAPAAEHLDCGLSPTGASAIVRSVWGAYVAIAWAQGIAHVLRDASGGLACYHSQIDGVHYLTSVPHLLIDCGLTAAEIDWDFIAHSLKQQRARLPATALQNIREVLPGTMLSCRADDMVDREIWDPWRTSRLPPPEHPAKELELVLSSTLAAWGRSTTRPLIELSGGLDSAIVAAGIAAAASGASLITFAAAPGDPDETAYAMAVAAHLGLPIEIVAPRIENVDLTLSLSRDLPRPNARAFTQAADRLSLDHGRSIGADAFFSGGGGDDVFCYLRTILPALDRLQTEGWRAMAGTARDLAVMTHSTYWEALARIMRRLVRGRSARSPADMRLLSRDIPPDDAAVEALGDDAAHAPGKADHVRGISTIHSFLEGHSRAQFAPLLSPLLSQPIVECCLAIPTWMWCAQGRNRAVARQAFATRLPKIVIERRSKGAFDGFCARLLRANQDLVREMLRDGQLARHRLLDLDAIDRALRDPSPAADTVARLLRLVDVESWVASWASRPLHRF